MDIVDVWAQSPLAVNGALHRLNGEEVEALSMLLTIPDMGFERPFPTIDPKDCPALLPVMASEGDFG
jgi:hypothetical protein